MNQAVEVEGRTLKLSNLDKVLYPEVGLTKGEVISYYTSVAPVLLPHLPGRPLTVKRYPNGVDGMFFFEKNASRGKPDWVRTARVPSMVVITSSSGKTPLFFLLSKVKSAGLILRCFETGPFPLPSTP